MSNKHEFQPRKVEKLFTSLRIGAGAPKICRFFDPIGTTAGNNFLTKWMHVSLDLFTMK